MLPSARQLMAFTSERGWLSTPLNRNMRSAGPLRGRVDAHALEVALHVARRLAQPLLVLDHRDPDIAFTLLAIADPGRHRDLGLGEQLLDRKSTRLNSSH